MHLKEEHVADVQKSRSRCMYCAALATGLDTGASEKSYSSKVQKEVGLYVKKKYRRWAVCFVVVVAAILPECARERSDNDVGRELIAKGDTAGAIAAYQRSVKKDPGDGKAWGKLGNLYMQNAEYRKAAEAYEKAATVEPGEAKFYIRLADARFRATDFDGSIAAAQRGLENKQVTADPRAADELKAAVKRAEMARTTRGTAVPESPTSGSQSAQTPSGGADESGNPPPDPHACMDFPKGELSTDTLKQIVPDDSPGRVFIKWRTESQEDNYGFNIYRGEKAGGPYTKVNESIIPGEGSTNIPKDYCYVDTPLPRGAVYYYYIESISNSGVAEIVEGTKDTRVKVKSVDEEREWLRKKALGIDTRPTPEPTSTGEGQSTAAAAAPTTVTASRPTPAPRPRLARQSPIPLLKFSDSAPHTTSPLE